MYETNNFESRKRRILIDLTKQHSILEDKIKNLKLLLITEQEDNNIINRITIYENVKTFRSKQENLKILMERILNGEDPTLVLLTQ